MSSFSKDIKKEAPRLAQWFEENARPLPWRKNKNPYRIWISEIMLQQTTVKAVIPFFNRFVKSFPKIQNLADAPLEDVYEHWAGLGYYSRARNIHKAAKELAQLKSFPKTYQKLIKLPGFGDYTARAVTSQAFAEPVGVVDGNVIRVLSRRFGLFNEHWKTKEKKQLQEVADLYAKNAEPRSINQALMELGATICTPTNPTCFLCPIQKKCVAKNDDLIEKLPLKKPKRATEIWQWEVELYEDKDSLAFVTNEYAPFLKKQLILPGKVKKSKTPPKDYDFQHAITHHKIYVKIIRKRSKFSKEKMSDFTWVSRKRLKEKVPFSLIQKTIDIGLGEK